VGAVFQIGLDEAGYGPLLGPLTIGAVRVDGPPGAFARALKRRDAFDSPRVDDSKVLYARGGLKAIERIALAASTLARGRTPSRVADFFDAPLEGAADHPWYGALDAPLPRAASVEEVEAAAAAFAAALGAEGARLRRAFARARLEGPLNASFIRTSCKGATHLEHMGEAMLDALVDAPDAEGSVVCDRLGGRKRYDAFLRDVFPFRPIDVVDESESSSRYVVRPKEAPLSVAFVVGGERAAPEVAVASCLAKYARELLMEAFNAHFAAIAPGIVPTAGYYEDGRRFLKDLEGRVGGGWSARLSRVR
jgi:ribonuclease HII